MSDKFIKDESKLIDLAFIADLAQRADGFQIQGGIGHKLRPFYLVPERDGGVGIRYPAFDYEIPLPDHIRQAVKIDELESFIAYIVAFKTHTAQIFATINTEGGAFTAVMDYHEGGNESKPGRARHTAFYKPPYSDDWVAWKKVDGQAMSQDSFLDHLRKWGSTITSQTDADLIELAQSLDFQVSGQYSSEVERTTGGRKLIFNHEVQGTAGKSSKVAVPDKLSIKLPVFMGGKEYAQDIDILYRPQNGSLKITLEMKRPHLTIRDAVRDIVADVEVGTLIRPFLGQTN